MMKLVITGCRGQLGNELMRILAEGRAEIGPIDTVYQDACVVGVDLDELDITDEAATKAFLQRQTPDVVINCAAMTNVDGCETDLQTAYRVNAAGVRNLAVACEAVGAKLIHISTDYVFAGDGTIPYREWDALNPQSIYGKSKALGEQYAMAFCRRTFVVRTSWLYGYIGKNFVKTVRRILREKGAMKVVNDQRGNPTNANDLAYHLLKLAHTEEYGIYHCTGNGECTWYEFACEIARLSGWPDTVSPCTSAEFNSPTRRPAFSSLAHLALDCSVGDAMRPWKDALAEYIKNVED